MSVIFWLFLGCVLVIFLLLFYGVFVSCDFYDCILLVAKIRKIRGKQNSVARFRMLGLFLFWLVFYCCLVFFLLGPNINNKTILGPITNRKNTKTSKTIFLVCYWSRNGSTHNWPYQQNRPQQVDLPLPNLLDQTKERASWQIEHIEKMTMISK